MDLFGGIEAGGTKFVCVAGSGPDDIRMEERFPTTSPVETIGKMVAFFQHAEKKLGKKFVSFGVASFGPVDLDTSSPTFGFITSTPKPGWKNTDLIGPLRKTFGVPVGFDTDVNGAAIGEGMWGAGKGLKHFIYITIGTGIGGGAVVDGKPLHGLIHPEMGHMLLPHDWDRDPFEGHCPYHGDCFEGMASGPALKARWGVSADGLPANHSAWDLEADYIASALQNLIAVLSPQRLILGGGVMQQEQLFPLIRGKLLEKMNNYFQSPAILNRMAEYVVPPGLGNQAGMLGALAMARNEIEK
ncbi:fructokinase [Ornatilinea apprima]|uniref:fructokinase n=1 Tax=Ornatilinea apprima TaxID=1134406 RepID=A0A0P6XWF9_9CHLR|nr:ROK family protein [Ornatilinea apprima]KPL79790.1 fructokinase [Ornatilinea apprima]